MEKEEEGTSVEGRVRDQPTKASDRAPELTEWTKQWMERPAQPWRVAQAMDTAHTFPWEGKRLNKSRFLPLRKRDAEVSTVIAPRREKQMVSWRLLL